MMMTPPNNVRRRNQEVPLIFTRVLLQWKPTIVAVQMTLAPTGTHLNALLTITARKIGFTHICSLHFYIGLVNV